MPEFNYMYVEEIENNEAKTVGVIIASDSRIKFVPSRNAQGYEDEFWNDRLAFAKKRGYTIEEIIQYFENFGNMQTTAISQRRRVIAKDIDNAASSALARSKTVETMLS